VIRLNAGSYGTHELAIGVGGGKKIRYSINAAIEKATGFSATNGGSFSHDPDKDGFDSKNFSARLSSPVGTKGQLSLKALQSRDEIEFDKGVSDTTNRALSLRYTHLTTARWTQTLTLANALDDIVTSSSNSSSITTRRISLDWQNDIRLGKGNLLTAGINLYRDHGVTDNLVSMTNTYNNRIYNRAAYISWQRRLGKHNLQISLRQDRHSQFGSNTTGLVGWGTQLSQRLRIWGTVGTAFKAPTLNDLYHPGYDYGSGTQYAGNPNLQPETSRNIEIGIKYRLTSTHHLAATLFRNRIRNLIAFATSFPNQITNIGTANIRGLELVYAFKLYAWQMQANATWQQARNGANGTTLLRRPDRKLTLTGSRKIGSRGAVRAEWLLLGHHEDYVGFSTGRVGGYGILNLAGHYQPRKGMTVGLRLDNLFDKRYQEAYGYNTPGRSAYLTFIYRR
jgi:vitamin B12 transporter